MDANQRLIKLGDMMGDGLHLEPGGKWITREYRQAMRELGLLPKKKRDPSVVAAIDAQMAKRCADVPCSKCGGELKQTRKGSMRGQCTECGAKYQLLSRRRAKT